MISETVVWISLPVEKRRSAKLSCCVVLTEALEFVEIDLDTAF